MTGLTILRASVLAPPADGLEAHRIVLAHVSDSFQPLVVWAEVFPKGRESYRVSGHYFEARDVDHAHRAFERRRGTLDEDLDPGNLVPGRYLAAQRALVGAPYTPEPHHLATARRYPPERGLPALP